MKEILLLIIAMVIGVSMTEHNKLTQEQNKLLITYCKAYEPCKKEMEQ